MKNNEIAFYFFKYGYLSLHIRGNEDSVQVFNIFFHVPEE